MWGLGVAVPVGVLAAVWMVMVALADPFEVRFTLAGLNDAVVAAGRFVAENVTVPAKPLTEATVKV
jgi:hypothetical protein